MFSADAGWSHLLPLVYYSLVRRHPHKLATTIAAQQQLTRIEASASLLKPCRPANRGPKEKNNKISTNTRLQRSYLIFTTDYKPSTLHLYNGRLAWVNLNHQKIIFCFGLILSANPFERFSSGLWLQCVDARDGNASGMKRPSWLALEQWADTVSAQDETDAILGLHSIPLSLQNKYKRSANVADRGSQFQTQETTLHYIVGDQEKEMEYRRRVHSFSSFLDFVYYICWNMKRYFFWLVVNTFSFFTGYFKCKRACVLWVNTLNIF